ncbi:NnrS family protein [bacterium]|jgi:uncharacterized protein involved in response to NO|nr:NnrS family protein [bacterium]
MSLNLKSFLSVGFRPFFFLAGIYAVLSVFLWMGIYSFFLDLRPTNIPSVYWHAHEMIFGYSLAVIAGFLLTAVKNWTGFNTIKGVPLLLLTIPWITSRVLMFTEWLPLIFPIISDTLFILLLFVILIRPIIKSKQWRNFGVIIKLAFLLSSNIIFYLGVTGAIPGGIRIGLYSALYMVVALIVLIGGRVIPFFIEKGVGYPVKLKKFPFMTIASLISFVSFFAFDIWDTYSIYSAVSAGIIAIILIIRLYGWYTPGIWKKPLLWVLYLAYTSIVIGFVLKVLSYTHGIGAHLSVHSFAYGGIGLSTLGMMSRVSWGHTGRSIQSPPKLVGYLFMLLVAGFILRVFCPLIFPTRYILFMIFSQIAWICAFSGFIFTYTRLFFGPRVDENK